MKLTQIIQILVTLALVLNLVGCGGSDNTKVSNQPTYTIGGNISGLSGGLELLNQGGDILFLSNNGSFVFSKSLASGKQYLVTINAQPNGQTCLLTNGSGTVSSTNYSGIVITCTDNTYTVGGTISGLSGDITLLNNGGNPITISSNGQFIFSSSLTPNSNYLVIISTQPSSQLCTINQNSGTIINSNVNDILVICSNAYTIGGSITGLMGSLTLLQKGTDPLVLNSDGSFTFATGILTHTSYEVTVGSQPEGKTCSVSNASGIVIDSNISNVSVTCVNTIIVTTLAGSGACCTLVDGISTTATFIGPRGLVVDASGNVYVADAKSNRIRKITPDGFVSTYAGSGSYGYIDGLASEASFRNPSAVVLDPYGNIYVADSSNARIRRISSQGVVSTFAGSGAGFSLDGIGNQASFEYIYGMTIDDAGNIYVTDGNMIRKISRSGMVSTFAGSTNSGNANGIGNDASFYSPRGVTVDKSGNLYVSDTGNNTIRKITPDRVVTTYAGSGARGSANGIGTEASFGFLNHITVDSDGNIYVVDSGNYLIRKISQSRLVTTVAGTGWFGKVDGIGSIASFEDPFGIAVDPLGNLYIGDYGNHVIRKITQ